MPCLSFYLCLVVVALWLSLSVTAFWILGPGRHRHSHVVPPLSSSCATTDDITTHPSSPSPVHALWKGRKCDDESFYDVIGHYCTPPVPLDDMVVGEESWIPFDPVKLEKIANDPPVFVLRNFIPAAERQELIEQALIQGLQQGQTQPPRQEQTLLSSSSSSSSSSSLLSPQVQHRHGSSVAWLSWEEESSIANFMAHLSARLFLHADLLERQNNDDNNGNIPLYYRPENVQVVKYDTGGRFDLHHDGLNRTVTVLTYLNGVAGTWFPFCDAPDSDIPQTTSLRDRDTILRGKRPGHDGVCIVGKECENDHYRVDASTNDNSKNPHVVSIQPGDAVVFYNYIPCHEYGMVWNWRSLHCGLPATQPKWIATNWFSLERERT